VAIVTFLLSFLARKANNIVQAIFGWSVVALFGRLRRRAQVLVTTALVLSLIWPLFLIGVAAPRVSAWAIAFVPMHSLIDNTALRVVWITLAIVAPLLVGLLVRLAAPHDTDSIPLALVRGVPIAIGFALAFVAVVVTVPIIKIASLVRRWSDEHVYVQAHDGAYDEAIACLVDACKQAGLSPEVRDAPAQMVLATTIMRKLASGAVSPFVGDRLRCVMAHGVELYLYPGDLLMRGLPFAVARVRATLSRTKLDALAYVVDSDRAKALQDDLSHVASDLESGTTPAATVRVLQDVYREVIHADITFDEWTILDGIARKLERQMIAARLAPPDAPPLDQVANEGGRAHLRLAPVRPMASAPRHVTVH
jgi:hypothetical protein